MAYFPPAKAKTSYSVPRSTRLGVGVEDQNEGASEFDVLGQASEIGNQAGRPPDPEYGIPSPIVGKQGTYDQAAILREFDNEFRNRRQTNTGVSGHMPGGIDPGIPEPVKPTQQEILLGMHNRPGVRAGSTALTPEEDEEMIAAEEAGVAEIADPEGAQAAADEMAAGGGQRMLGNDPNSTTTFRWAERGGINPEFFAGFDLQRDQNPNKSAKDRTAELFAASGVNPAQFAGPEGKANAEKFFREQIAPGLMESGYEVVDVKGDQAYIRSWDGEGWTDFMINAGADDPGSIKFAWQPQTGEMGGGAMGGGDAGLMSMLGAEDGGGDILAQIMAALNELQAGGDPYLNEALKAQFQGAA